MSVVPLARQELGLVSEGSTAVASGAAFPDRLPQGLRGPQPGLLGPNQQFDDLRSEDC